MIGRTTAPRIGCLVYSLAIACSDRGVAVASEGGDGTTTVAVTSSSTSSTGADTSTTTIKHDLLDGTGDPPGVSPFCPVEQPYCQLFDVLIVVDNSGTMTQEQGHVAASLASMVDELQVLTDSAGIQVEPSVNIMVTTTDLGHPLCTPLQKPGYVPAGGTPVYDGCNARIARFTGLGQDPAVVEEACTDVCPRDIVPSDPFIHFDVAGTNVPSGTPAQALACIGPQGIDGCEYESPLEAMLRALDPTACWNDPAGEGCDEDPRWADLEQPFLRDGSYVGVVIITDEADCSVDAPGGLSYFTDPDNDQYWEIEPSSGLPEVSSAVCWNAGVTCNGPDQDGVYSDCVSTDNGVLHPVTRYTDALLALREQGHDVAMLGMLGVPEVTAHNPNAPFEPHTGGVHALEYRVWNDADLTPDEQAAGVTVADKVWQFGDIAPGCANEAGSAIFPTRVQEVCDAMNEPDDPATESIDESRPRCCIESICHDDLHAAIRCLTVPSGIILK